MLPAELKVRRKTLPAIFMFIGGIVLVAFIVLVTYQFAHSKDDAGRSLAAVEVSLLACILSVVSFRQSCVTVGRPGCYFGLSI